MKKIMASLLVVLIFCGCSKKEQKEIKKETKPIIEETYKDENNVVLGIYQYQNDLPTLINTYTSNWVNGEDISYFTIFYTQENQLTYEPFVTLYNKYAKDTKVKNGIMLEFSLGDKKIKKTILNPKDVWEYFDYVQVYLYDDTFHQFDSWYSHTTEEEFNDNTIISTFKITAGYHMDEVTSDVIVTAFTIDSEDDIKDGIYRGNSFYKLTLKRG